MDGQSATGRVVGRYVLYDEIASGGMATIHLGCLMGQVGFARVVAIKKLHPHLAKDPEFVAMFLDEARVAAGVRHPNVVSTLDVVATDGELFLVMDYVEGDSLSRLLRAARRKNELLPPPLVSSVMTGVLYGLHAAHTAKDERGQSLSIVHRDVSPQNVLVGVDGVARVVDFGVAKASRRLMETEAGRMKGKFAYMAPEQVRQDTLDQRADVFAAGICAWEALTGKHLFSADDPGRTIAKLLESQVPPPSSMAPDVSPELDAVVLRALERSPDARFQTAREMAIALEDAVPPWVARKVGEWVLASVGPELEKRGKRLAELSSQTHARAPASLAAAQELIGRSSVAPEPEDEAPTRVHEVSSHPSLSAARAPETGTPISHVSVLSDVSNASYTTPPPARIPRRGLVAVAIALVSAALLVVVGAIVLLGRRAEPQAHDVAAAPPEETAAAPPSVQLEPIATAPPEPAPQASAEPEPEPSATAPKPEPKQPSIAKPVVTAPPQQKNCNPPYTIENGIKKFKRECL
ncbi:MAG: protein kinase [Myxococcales bacterium]|nr:protein kinase [Myxococcales bacterium]MCB9578922.1 protein kinase [Polyangiaceae bacterium]